MCRKTIKGGVADQNFGGLMHFIWAVGQDKAGSSFSPTH
jgi:hypothetical protein